MCGQSLKTIFWKFEQNHHGNNICQNNNNNNNKLKFFYTFKFVATKNLWKFTMFQESFYMFKAFKKCMWTCGFLVSKVFFPYQMFTKSFQFFFEL
jgi:hypothetical protein